MATTDRADLTPVSVNYYENIAFTFNTNPKTRTMAYEIYKSIYIQKRDKIKVVSKLHQNSFDDVLHFSVRVEIANNWYNTLHYNGMWNGNVFITDNITALGPNNFIEVVAQF
jgi:predicted methyltransferase